MRSSRVHQNRLIWGLNKIRRIIKAAEFGSGHREYGHCVEFVDALASLLLLYLGANEDKEKNIGEMASRIESIEEPI